MSAINQDKSFSALTGIITTTAVIALNNNLTTTLNPSGAVNLFTGSYPSGISYISLFANLSWYDTVNSLTSLPLVHPQIKLTLYSKGTPITSTFHFSSASLNGFTYTGTLTATLPILNTSRDSSYTIDLISLTTVGTAGTRTSKVIVNGLDIIHQY